MELVEPQQGLGADAAARLQREPAVLYAEADRRRSAVARPDDPLIGPQSGLDRVRVPAAWDSTTGSADVRVAVVDTGVDPEHPDLLANLVSGWHFLDGDAAPQDPTEVPPAAT
jgi:subtilisin family serine protease